MLGPFIRSPIYSRIAWRLGDGEGCQPIVATTAPELKKSLRHAYAGTRLKSTVRVLDWMRVTSRN